MASAAPGGSSSSPSGKSPGNFKHPARPEFFSGLVSFWAGRKKNGAAIGGPVGIGAELNDQALAGSYVSGIGTGGSAMVPLRSRFFGNVSSGDSIAVGALGWPAFLAASLSQ